MGQTKGTILQNLDQPVIVKARDAGGELNLVFPSVFGIHSGKRVIRRQCAQRRKHQSAHLTISALESLPRAGAALPQSGAAGFEKCTIIRNRANLA